MKGISFLLIPLYTSVLTPEEYGQLELLNGMGNILSIILSFGMTTYLTVEYYHLIGKSKMEFIRDVISTYLYFGLMFWIFLSFNILIFKSKLLSDDVSLLTVFIALVISYLTFFQNAFFSILQIKKQAIKLTLYRVAIGVLTAVINIFFVYYIRIGILGIFLANFIMLAASLVFAFDEYFKKVDRKLFNFNLSKYLNLIKASLPYVGGTLAYWTLSGVDRWFILNYLGEREVGIYAAAYKLSSFYEALLISPIVAVYTPYIFERFSKGTFDQNFKIVVPFVVILFIGLGFATKWIGGFMLNASYHEALQYIPFLTIAFGFFFLCQITASKLVYSKNAKLLLLNIVTASVINIILNFFLILKYGLYGATFAFVISNLIWLLITFYQIRTLKKI